MFFENHSECTIRACDGAFVFKVTSERFSSPKENAQARSEIGTNVVERGKDPAEALEAGARSGERQQVSGESSASTRSPQRGSLPDVNVNYPTCRFSTRADALAFTLGMCRSSC